jgi:hypothetical protein
MALLYFAPSPAVAQDQPELSTTVVVGKGDAAAGSVVVTCALLGSDKPLPGFKVLVHARLADKSAVSLDGMTDDAGRLTIELREVPSVLRVFAYGDFTIPDGWSTIPVDAAKLKDGPLQWSAQVRPLKRIKVSGQVSIDGRTEAAARATVAFAPLDVAQDGSFRLFDEPRSANTDENGRYELELPTGYYQVWSYWADRSTADWVQYIKVDQKHGIFADTVLNMKLEEGPMFEGRVIDGRTGEGVPASINLYTNQYLRQLRNFTADGRFPDAQDENGEDVFWPVGTFKLQAWLIDPNDFTVVIRPAGNDQVLRVIRNLKAADLVGKKITWSLYDDSMTTLDLKITTHELDLPVNGIDINLRPLLIDAPAHLADSYSAAGFTKDDGVVRFMGLAPGSYEAYGSRGSMFLGKVEVTAEKQQTLDLVFKLPFAHGNVKLEDGTVCKNLIVFVWITNKVGQEFGPYSSDAFKENPILQDKGTVFVPLTSFGSTFRLRFAGFEGGREFGEREWVRPSDFPLVTDDFIVKVDEEKGWKLDLTLKANTEYKPPEKD